MTKKPTEPIDEPEIEEPGAPVPTDPTDLADKPEETVASVTKKPTYLKDESEVEEPFAPVTTELSDSRTRSPLLI